VTAIAHGFRRAKHLAILAGVVAFWLAGGGSANASCGDYLVGVEQGDHSSAPTPAAPHGDRTPRCRSCHLPIVPAAPTITIERVPIDPALIAGDPKIELDRGRWWRAEPSMACEHLSRAPDRPPKV
jgi:hypothetical protein